MRTTVDIDPVLHAEALEYARRERITLGEVLNDALRARLHPLPPIRISENTGLAETTNSGFVSGRVRSVDELTRDAQP